MFFTIFDTYGCQFNIVQLKTNEITGASPYNLLLFLSLDE